MEHRRMPLRRDDINKKVLKENARAFVVVFQRAQERLREVFGMEMVELPVREKKQSSNQAGRRAGAAAKTDRATATSRAYVLRSVLSANERTVALDWDTEEPSMVLLCIILGLIHVSGRRIDEADLTNHLKRLGLHRSGAPHPIFNATLDEILADHVKHGYLDRYRLDETDADQQPLHAYTWGPRARVEMPEEAMMAFVTDAYTDLTPLAKARLEKDVARLAGPAGVIVQEEEEGEEGARDGRRPVRARG
ncbi:hypothetical protein HKX48_009353 [Thoreauomyces humboldtii]|nr:hypothetical protein HKX48_009353 [Thoreauomyces humboldtii]